ncbi:hypothetical protein LUZ60_017757 [Juncus effusus]|nr:hypothetical protein LUZ60_017757 [Juncus effusus]
MPLFFFFLILFLSFSSLLSAQNDEATLLKIKEQLGNPIELKNWVPGFDYCNQSWSENMSSYLDCTGTGRVKSFILNNLNVNSTFPSAIFDLTELENVVLQYMSGLYGQIPYCIGNLHHLTALSISYTSLSGPIPSSLADITNLELLIMNNNKLFGPIPKSLSELKYLSWLILSNNRLSGPILPGLVHGSPSKLINLDLSYNDLSGELPEYYGGPYFDQIDLSHNRLSGDASFLFGKEKETYLIRLSYNNFEFDLSHIEANADKLTVLDIKYNRIWGRIPQSVGDIGGIDLSNNQLCGPIPTWRYSWDQPVEAYANNSCLCGVPLPPCCNE